MALAKLFQVRCDGGINCQHQGGLVPSATEARQVRYSAGIKRVLIGRYAFRRVDGTLTRSHPEYRDLCEGHRSESWRGAIRERLDAAKGTMGYERV